MFSSVARTDRHWAATAISYQIQLSTLVRMFQESERERERERGKEEKSKATKDI
jgi:hypothetical protein